MTVELRFRPEFEADVREAADWYDERSPGLGSRFKAELDSALGRIARQPLTFAVIAPSVRRLKLNVFPYLVIYRCHDDFVEVVTVVHGARHPRKRTSRLDEP